MRNNAFILNQHSLSNDALMRCIPLAIYAYKAKLTCQDIYKLVHMDVTLTHANSQVIHKLFTWSIFIFKCYYIIIRQRIARGME